MLIGIDASRANRKRKTGTEWYSFYLIENLAKLDKNNTYRLYVDDRPSPELQEAIEKAIEVANLRGIGSVDLTGVDPSTRRLIEARMERRIP